MTQGSFKVISRGHQECFKGVSLSISKVFKKVSRKNLRCFKDVSCCMAFITATQNENVVIDNANSGGNMIPFMIWRMDWQRRGKLNLGIDGAWSEL